VLNYSAKQSLTKIPTGNMNIIFAILTASLNHLIPEIHKINCNYYLEA
jgi:hypothetical protein